MLRPILFLCLFSLSFGGIVKILQGSNLYFYVGEKKTLTCDAADASGFSLPVDRYQWLLSCPNLKETYYSNFSPDYEFKFSGTGSCKIMCQARVSDDKYFTNSTPSHLDVYPDPPNSKSVEIVESEPIRFKLNIPKTVTCNDRGFRSIGVTYRWVNGTENNLFVTTSTSRQQFRFPRPERGFLICQAMAKNDLSYMSSKPKAYVVESGQRIGICYFTIATAVGIAMLLI